MNISSNLSNFLQWKLYDSFSARNGPHQWQCDRAVEKREVAIYRSERRQFATTGTYYLQPIELGIYINFQLKYIRLGSKSDYGFVKIDTELSYLFWRGELEFFQSLDVRDSVIQSTMHRS